MKRLYAICLLVTLGLFSCAKTEERMLRYISDVEPETLDPRQATGVTEIRLINGIFEGLVRLNDSTLEPEARLAEKIEISPDKKIYSFLLREAFWSDGKKITPGDFIKSYMKCLDKKNAFPYAGLFFSIKNAKQYYDGILTDFSAVGISSGPADSLTFELENPLPYFLSLLSMPVFFPVRIDHEEKHGRNHLKPGNIAVSGAFIPVKRRINQEIILKKNPLYWDKANVLIEKIRIIISPDINTAFNIYETGGADILTSVPAEVLRRIKGREDLHISPYIGTYFYRINSTGKFLSNSLLRKAVSLSINRGEIAKYILSRDELPAESFIPGGLPGYSAKEKLSPYNPILAKELLKKSGLDIKKMPPLVISYNTSEEHRHIAETVKNGIEKTLGIKVELKNQEWKVFAENVKKLEYDIARASWIGDYPEPSTFLDIFRSDSKNNRTGWKSGRYDKILDLAAAEKKPKKRNALYAEAEELLISGEAVIIPVYFYSAANLYRKDIKGLSPNMQNLIYFGKLFRGIK